LTFEISNELQNSWYYSIITIPKGTKKKRQNVKCMQSRVTKVFGITLLF